MEERKYQRKYQPSEVLCQLGPETYHYQKENFDNQLKQALVATKDIELESMHRDDVELLNFLLHERCGLMNTSMKFHYGRLAQLFDCNTDEIRCLDNAEQVLSWIAARRKEQYTVADILDKLVQCGKCSFVVRKLVDQIVDREQH